uniref:Angel homolog 1 (Drosophila) n=1 Tax=Labrus bergylta TaxID=56723 RepID=A0A3Q3E2T6_9LABR|nr:protein angel homolog 1 [Labrus bergylta]
MVGSVLFYVLYPLSRFLTGRQSEAPQKGHPAVVNGKAVWDGGAVKTRRFTQTQTSLLDQWLSSSSGTETEKKERMKEPVPEEKCDTRPHTDKEELIPVLQNDATSKNSDVQPAERRNGKVHDDQEEAPEKETRKIPHEFEEYYVTQHTQEGSVFRTEDITPQQDLCAQLECLKMEESAPETISSVLEKLEKPSLEDPATSAQTNIQEATCQTQEQTQLPTVTELKAPDKTPAEITEFWDDYLLPAADEMQEGGSSSKLVFASPLFNTQTHLQICNEHDTQTGWHFPAGLGLAEEVQCPLWQFPAVSYYPPLEPTAQFEVMWRVWEEVDESAPAEGTSLKPLPFTNASMEFTVMSYNILAQDLLEANEGLYTHCPLEVLDWSYRCSLLLEEILKWAPDILCLQEVQENHYQEQLFPVLSQMGYSCVYKRRTGNKTDGCATCYRSGRFSELSVTLLEFLRPDTELLDRHNVGIVLLLQPVVTKGPEIKAKGPPLCVANTHLIFNPRRGDVKLAQLAILLADIDSVVKSCKAKGEHCNLILCGDFNALPHTPLYQLVATGELYFQGLPAWMISGQEDLSYNIHCHRLQAPLWPSSVGITDSCQYSTVKEILENQHQKPGNRQFSHDFLLQLRFCPAACVRPLDLVLIPGVTDNTPDASRKKNLPYDKSFRHTIRHQFDLESVYKHILPGSGYPEITTLHSEGAATVDYIFYTQRRLLTPDQNVGGNSVNEGLQLIGSLSLLSEDVLLSMRGLPNHIFPSDHLSLLAKFQLELNAS